MTYNATQSSPSFVQGSLQFYSAVQGSGVQKGICIHEASSTIGVYLQLETAAAKDLVPTMCGFGKGGLL